MKFIPGITFVSSKKFEGGKFGVKHYRVFVTTSGNNENDDDNSSMGESSDASSVSSNHDPSNGRSLDRHAAVAEAHRGDTEGLEKYVEDKTSSINSQRDSELGALLGTPLNTPENRNRISDHANSLIQELHFSVDTIFDLADIPMSDEEEEGDDSPSSEEGSPSSDEGYTRPAEGSPRPDEGSPRPAEGSPGSGEGSPRPDEGSPRPDEGSPRSEGEVQPSPRFPQDSSHVERTDLMSDF